MLTRRQFLETTLKKSSLVALGSAVPTFLAATARAAVPGKDTVLVVLEMGGGNDGLNTVIPYADDLYHKARPTLGLNKSQIVRLDDYIGLNPGLRSFEKLLSNGQLAIVQGVGYPNPNRSHFESMEIWQSGDPRLKIGSGWLGRSMSELRMREGHIPGIYVGTQDLPLALQGSASCVPTIHANKPYDLDLGGRVAQAGPPSVTAEEPAVALKEAKPAQPASADSVDARRRVARRKLIEELAQPSACSQAGMLPFVQRSALQTYASIKRLREITRDDRRQPDSGISVQEVGSSSGPLHEDLDLVAKLIEAGFGTRIFYVAINGFDTHFNQRNDHERVLREMADGIAGFFARLQKAGHAQRVLLMTFSEFGRRVRENSSKGTDHGAASCVFVAGPGAKGGLIGRHPSLADLGDGDLKYHTDFRQVYATLLDRWLECDSRRVLGDKFQHVPLLKKT